MISALISGNQSSQPRISDWAVVLVSIRGHNFAGSARGTPPVWVNESSAQYPCVKRHRSCSNERRAEGLTTPVDDGEVSGHRWPVYGSHRLRAAGPVTARGVPPVVPWSSRQVGCREVRSVKDVQRRYVEMEPRGSVRRACCSYIAPALFRRLKHLVVDEGKTLQQHMSTRGLKPSP